VWWRLWWGLGWGGEGVGVGWVGFGWGGGCSLFVCGRGGRREMLVLLIISRLWVGWFCSCISGRWGNWRLLVWRRGGYVSDLGASYSYSLVG